MMLRILLFASAVTALAGCATAPVADRCAGPLDPRLEPALADASERLRSGCEYDFDRYFAELLERAEDAPEPRNRRLFSDFLVQAADAGVIARRRAADLYNRYFEVRFVSLSGDFNTCSQVCPDPDRVLDAMAAELGHKETGLLRIAGDSAAYYRADSLFKQSQLVLAATCDACTARGTATP
jgi:hypothetical protein